MKAVIIIGLSGICVYYIFYSIITLVKAKKKKKEAQITLFDLDENKPDEEGKFLKQYLSHYRRLAENG